MIETGWELPAGGQARTVAEILQAPASPEERRQLRREAASRRRAAIEVLKPLGLADVITGGASGAVLDVNLGILEPAPDVAQRARMDYEYEAARAEVAASSRRRAVDRYRERLDERYRARFR